MLTDCGFRSVKHVFVLLEIKNPPLAIYEQRQDALVHYVGITGHTVCISFCTPSGLNEDIFPVWLIVVTIILSVVVGFALILAVLYGLYRFFSPRKGMLSIECLKPLRLQVWRHKHAFLLHEQDPLQNDAFLV